MFTRNSKLRDIYASPVGHDVVQTLLAQTGVKEGLVTNPVTGSLSLAALQKLSAGKLDEDMLRAILTMLNSEQETPPLPTGPASHKWWKEAVAYQIYPRSFCDANGDGIGDLAGITSKIPYLKRLGVNLLWLSPIYDSPNDDCGYDIRNYRRIMTEFGAMKDFDTLLETAHAAGIRLIMDLVVNHTSDEHKWFKEACKDRENPYHDYYLWREGAGPDGRQPPNNWTSFFGGSAWNYYPKCGQWALHLFSKKQMDLNWENPALRAEVYEMMRFWLDKGVDGFRMDVINYISKESLADGSEALGGLTGFYGIEHYFYGPHLHEYLREMRRESFGRYDSFTVGEAPATGRELAKMLTAESRGELDTVFNFDHLENLGKNRYTAYKYDLRYLKKYYLDWQQNFKENCWQSLFFDNHDNQRMVGKVTQDPSLQPRVAKLLAVIQMTLRGTPFVFQGDELGMGNAKFESADELRDVEAVNRYHELMEKGMTEQEAFSIAAHGTRDHARTPMPWTGAKNAGFTKGEPWLRLTPGWELKNAAAEQKDKTSVWHAYQTLIALRRANPALVYGEFRPVFAKGRRYADVFCYFRVGENRKFYVECNLTGHMVSRPAPLSPNLKQVYGTWEQTGDALKLRPYEACVYRVE